MLHGVPVQSVHIAWEVMHNLKVSILHGRSHTIMMRGVPVESVYIAWEVMHKAERKHIAWCWSHCGTMHIAWEVMHN